MFMTSTYFTPARALCKSGEIQAEKKAKEDRRGKMKSELF